MPILPLFPLGTVLLPGEHLPLQIFEPRYVRLLQDLSVLPLTDRRFGVVAIRRGHEVGPGRATDLFEVGCAAQPTEPRAARGAGDAPVYHLVAEGTLRFRLNRVLVGAGTPYPTGDVAWMDTAEEDQLDETDELIALASQVRAAHAAYLAALHLAPITLDEPAAQLAYRAAEHSALPVPARQRVLAAAGPAERLREVAAALRRETSLLQQFRAHPAPPPTSFNPN